jgi:hypothetical protein
MSSAGKGSSREGGLEQPEPQQLDLDLDLDSKIKDSDKEIPYYSGSCYCGAVSYQVNECQPHKAVYCHCESCRRAHAAPLYHVVYVKAADIRVTQGDDKLNNFTKPGSTVMRSFCAVCGSRMFNRLQRDADWIGFFPATLQESVQHALPRCFQPTEHYLAEEAVLDIRVLPLCD